MHTDMQPRCTQPGTRTLRLLTGCCIKNQSPNVQMDTTGPSAHPAGFSGCFCWEPRLWSAHLASPMSKCHTETGAHAKDKVNTMSHPLPTRNCAAAAGVHDPTLNVRRMEPQGVSEPTPQGACQCLSHSSLPPE